MTPDELVALAPSLSGDFKSIDAHLRALDKHLTLRSYLGGYVLSDADTKIWLALRSNKAAFGFVRGGSLANLTRWFTFVEVNHPEIQGEIKSAQAEKYAKQAAASKAGGSYNISLPDAEKGVVTRFLPEPSCVTTHPSAHFAQVILTRFQGLPSYRTCEGRPPLRLFCPPTLRWEASPASR